MNGTVHLLIAKQQFGALLPRSDPQTHSSAGPQTTAYLQQLPASNSVFYPHTNKHTFLWRCSILLLLSPLPPSSSLPPPDAAAAGVGFTGAAAVLIAVAAVAVVLGAALAACCSCWVSSSSGLSEGLAADFIKPFIPLRPILAVLFAVLLFVAKSAADQDARVVPPTPKDGIRGQQEQ
jgi:hypothetical protein